MASERNRERLRELLRRDREPRAVYRDYPREQVIAGANKALRTLAEQGVEAEVHFKATCPHCGARPEFDEPNAWFEQMTCCQCGESFPFERGNYSIWQVRRR